MHRGYMGIISAHRREERGSRLGELPSRFVSGDFASPIASTRSAAGLVHHGGPPSPHTQNLARVTTPADRHAIGLVPQQPVSGRAIWKHGPRPQGP